MILNVLTERMTDEEVEPVLDRISSNLTSVESSIIEAQTLQSDLEDLQNNFIAVRT